MSDKDLLISTAVSNSDNGCQYLASVGSTLIPSIDILENLRYQCTPMDINVNLKQENKLVYIYQFYKGKMITYKINSRDDIELVFNEVLITNAEPLNYRTILKLKEWVGEGVWRIEQTLNLLKDNSSTTQLFKLTNIKESEIANLIQLARTSEEPTLTVHKSDIVRID